MQFYIAETFCICTDISISKLSHQFLMSPLCFNFFGKVIVPNSTKHNKMHNQANEPQNIEFIFSHLPKSLL